MHKRIHIIGQCYSIIIILPFNLLIIRMFYVNYTKPYICVHCLAILVDQCIVDVASYCSQTYYRLDLLHSMFYVPLCLLQWQFDCAMYKGIYST